MTIEDTCCLVPVLFSAGFIMWSYPFERWQGKIVKLLGCVMILGSCVLTASVIYLFLTFED